MDVFVVQCGWIWVVVGGFGWFLVLVPTAHLTDKH